MTINQVTRRDGETFIRLGATTCPSPARSPTPSFN